MESTGTSALMLKSSFDHAVCDTKQDFESGLRGFVQEYRGDDTIMMVSQTRP